MDFNFKRWLEYSSAKQNGIKDTILNFLKDELNVKDEDTILSMKIGSIDNSIINDLMSRGIVKTSDGDILDDIKNGSITVQDLIDKLSGQSDNSQALNLNVNNGENDSFTN
jgi:hypothetical protein